MDVSRSSRTILINGLLLILTGLLFGLVIPMTPFPRLALTAHVEFEVNGFLISILAVVLYAVPNRVGKSSFAVMVLAVALTWIMLFSEAGNAWWGTNQTLPIAAGLAGAKGGTAWQELFVKLSHIIASVGLITAWVLLIIGIWREKPSAA